MLPWPAQLAAGPQWHRRQCQGWQLHRSCPVHRANRATAVKFKPADELELLLDQARAAPTVQARPAPNQPLQHQQHQLQQPGTASDTAGRQLQHQDDGQPAPAVQQAIQPAVGQLHVPSRRLRPSRMDFGVMLVQLQAWQQRHLTAHVPRHCYDAPELGAWVRYMRKQHRSGLLEQWKVEQLNALCFEWELNDVDARWHHQYHQLRRYRSLYGSTQLDCSTSSRDQCEWVSVDRWLHKQAKLLAKQKLSSVKKAMLQQLGITLVVPKRIVSRTAQLQGMNGPERRKLRKKWKLQDNLAAEQRWQQHQAALQERQRDEHQRRLLMRRRQQLRRQAMLEAAQRDISTQQLQHAGRQDVGSNGVKLAVTGCDSSLQQQQRRAAVVQQLPSDAGVAEVEPASPQQQQQQQQQQPPPAPAEVPLLYQRNQRLSRMRHRSRQEQWLAQ